MDITKEYNIIEILGEGYEAVVFKVTPKTGLKGEFRALKIYNREVN